MVQAVVRVSGAANTAVRVDGYTDDTVMQFGTSNDSGILYDGSNDEWTVQTRNASGTLTDRIRTDGNTDTPALATVNIGSVDLDASGAIQINSSAGAISIANDNIDQTVNLATAGTRTLNIGIDDGTDVTTIDVNGNMTLKGVTPVLTIGDAGAEDATLLFDGNAVDYHFGLHDSEDAVVLGKGTALGTTPLQYWDYSDANSQLISFGTTPSGSVPFKVQMTHASTGTNGTLQHLKTTTTLTPGGAGSWNGLLVENTYTIASDTVANIYNCRVKAPTINNSGTISGDTAAMYIQGASDATISGTNYTMLVGSGITRLSGGARIGSNSTNNLIDDATNGSSTQTLYIGTYTIDVSAPSDSILKENIVDTTIDSLSILDQLQLRDFNWKEDNPNYGHLREKQFGMVAQEVEEVLPHLVRQDSEGVRNVQYNKMIPYLVKAIQELKQELREVKNG